MHPRFLAACVLLTACATAAQAGSGRADSDVISRAEILAASGATAEDVIRQLRPDWLTPAVQQTRVSRGQIEVCKVSGPLVYVGRRRSRQRLSEIAAERVAEIRYMRPGALRPDGDSSCQNLAAIQLTLVERP